MPAELQGDQHYFSPCPRGLEAVLADELAALGADAVKAVPGGVAFSGPWALVYRVNLESRIATRVLWRVGHGPYRKEDDIFKLALGLAWEHWFSPRCTLRVYTTAVRSPLKSVDFVTLRVKDAICDRATAVPDCRSEIRMELRPVSTTTWNLPSESMRCVDRDADMVTACLSSVHAVLHALILVVVMLLTSLMVGAIITALTA